MDYNRIGGWGYIDKKRVDDRSHPPVGLLKTLTAPMFVEQPHFLRRLAHPHQLRQW